MSDAFMARIFVPDRDPEGGASDLPHGGGRVYAVVASIERIGDKDGQEFYGL
jgi:hypothetical protein